MYKYRRYHPIFGNNQHGWFFTHMCGFYPTSEYIVRRYLEKTTHVWFLPNTSKSLYCLEKNTHVWLLLWYHGILPWYHGISCTFEYWKFGKYAA